MDKFTFGNTPAAIYLADRLNTLGDTILSRKVSTNLTAVRSVITQLITAQYAGLVDVKTVAFVAQALRAKVDNSAKVLMSQGYDSLVIDLASNVAIGDIKRITRRAQIVKIKERQNARVAEEGTAPTKVTIAEIRDEKTADLLIQRSKKTLARLGKRCTFY